jgi:HSP20 family protein
MTTTGLYFHPYPRTGLDISNGSLDKLAKAFFGHDVVKTSDFSVTENSMLLKTEAGYELNLVVPGFAREDIAITLEGRNLSVEGKTQNVNESQKKIFSSFGINNFKKTIVLHHEVEMSEINAQLVNGILTVKIPRAKASEKHNIPIL